MRSVWALFVDLLTVLPPGARGYLIRYSIALGLLSILDAAALALLALIMSPILSGSSVTVPFIGTVEGGALIAMLGLVCLLIILKGLIAVFLLWRATRRFAAYELVLGSRLFDSFVASSWVERLKRNSAELHAAPNPANGS